MQDRPVCELRTCDIRIGGITVSDEISDIVTDNPPPFRVSQEEQLVDQESW